ncbi:MAG: uroporphyrinogen-III synthase [Armatimonadota bacterium]|nr:uroporphyrinogen-III synthase [Armatimonadota bacterium]
MVRPHAPRAARRQRPASGAAQPLAGRRILVTRPRAAARALCARLRALGATVVAIPTVEILPAPAKSLDRALRRIGRYDWIVVTSANGARVLVTRAQALGLDLRRARRPRWAAVGPATAAVLRAAGVRVAKIPSRYLTEALGRELPDVAGRRVLLARADLASPDLARRLAARGAHVETVVAYRTRVAPRASALPLRRALARPFDAIVCTSASTVRGLVRLAGRARLRTSTLACIGPVTAAAARAAGLRPQIVARTHTVDGLLDALVATLQTKGATDVASCRAG